MPKPVIVCVVGTRPEAIKVAPVVLELRKFADQVDTVLLSTGQHREMLDQALAAFNLRPDEDLALMRHGQSLVDLTARALQDLDKAFERLKPAHVVVQGDTTSTFTGSLAAFYRSIPIAHVEAGLRTDTIDNPFPEEFNRRATGLIANLHLAPTAWAADNLLKEGKDPTTVMVTGNTGIDAVRHVAAASDEAWLPDHRGRVLLLTTHRRENWGDPQRRIASACRRIVDKYPDTVLVVAQHRNPQVRLLLHEVLGDHSRVKLIEPPEYAHFVKLMQRCSLILSDSGGVQEEAPAFGIPVLVLRETTERPEGVTAGTAKLVGTDDEAIFQTACDLLDSPTAHAAMSHAVSPYGDGRASARIRFALMNALHLESPTETMWA
jgi:UDP-N-acetylglucosamine 2-epimerase (non-hydrolysing)